MNCITVNYMKFKQKKPFVCGGYMKLFEMSFPVLEIPWREKAIFIS